MKTILAMLCAAFLGAAAAGCIVHARGPHGGVAVVVPGVHVHDSFCGHYYHGDRWYYYHGHHHGPGCGHVYIGGRWTIRVGH